LDNKKNVSIIVILNQKEEIINRRSFFESLSTIQFLSPECSAFHTAHLGSTFHIEMPTKS